MKRFLFLLLAISLSINIFAKNFNSDKHSFGNPTTSDNVRLNFKDGGYIEKKNDAEFVFSEDGTNEKKFGSGSGSGSSGVNLLLNPGAEDGESEWNNVGGAFSVQSYANPDPQETNTKFFRFVASGSGQKVSQVISAWPDFISGGCMADLRYTQGDDAFTYKVIKDPSGTPDVLASGSISDKSNWNKAPVITFPCPEGGEALAFEIESTGSGTIDFDQSYTGSNKNLGFGEYTQINTCGLVGNDERTITANTESIPFDGSCVGWTSGANGSSTSNGNYYEVQFNDSIVTLSVGIGFDSREEINPYLYKNGSYYKRIATQPSSGATAVFYGGTYISDKGEFAKGDKLVIVSGSNGGTLEDRDEEHYLNIVEKSTSESVTPFSPEEANFYIEGSIGGSSNISISTNSSPTLVTDSGLDVVMKEGSASIACDNAASTGSTCSGSDEALGITFNTPRAGVYKSCFTFGVNADSSAVFRVSKTENNSNTILETSSESFLASGSGSISSTRLCGLFNAANKGDTTLKIFYEATGSGTVYADRNTNQYDRDISFTVELVRHNVSAPILVRQDFVYGQEVKLTDKYNGETAYKYCNRVGLETGESNITSNTTIETKSTGLKPIKSIRYTGSYWMLFNANKEDSNSYITYDSSTGEIEGFPSSNKIDALTVYCLEYTK